MTINLKSFWVWVAIVVALVLLFFLGSWLFSKYHDSNLEGLKQENIRITQEYNQKISEARANELAAREEALQARALNEELKKHAANIKQIEAKIEESEKQYEQDKANLGDCGTPAECSRLLCKQLLAAGFKVTCPE